MSNKYRIVEEDSRFFIEKLTVKKSYFGLKKEYSYSDFNNACFLSNCVATFEEAESRLKQHIKVENRTPVFYYYDENGSRLTTKV